MNYKLYNIQLHIIQDIHYAVYTSAMFKKAFLIGLQVYCTMRKNISQRRNFTNC